MLSPKKRFEVLKRDNFRCQYCGKTGKDVTLEVDHIKPRSKWGTDDMENLITCCRECNMGKWDTEITEQSTTRILERETIDRLLKKFYTEWNKRLLWTIDKKTSSFLAAYINTLVTIQNCDYITEHELAYRNVAWVDVTKEIWEEARKKYEEWWERTIEVLESVELDVEISLIGLIDEVTEEESRTWAKNYSSRLNHQLTYYTYDDEDLKWVCKKYTLYPNIEIEWE